MSLVFVGGGNMAAAIIGGLRRKAAAEPILVVERDGARRIVLERDFAVATQASIDAALAPSSLVVIAVKPPEVREVCTALQALAGTRLLVSIAAGIPSAAIARWAGSECVVRAMPNTPALVGQGISGLYARAAVTPGQRAAASQVLQAVGEAVWLAEEAMLDAVTAISGSGPAYVFYFLEALQDAAQRMGMDPAQARQFCIRTFAGAAQLAQQSDEPIAVLRERVTSKGGTTAAALSHLRAANVAQAIAEAALAARDRSREMAREYGS